MAWREREAKRMLKSISSFKSKVKRTFSAELTKDELINLIDNTKLNKTYVGENKIIKDNVCVHYKVCYINYYKNMHGVFKAGILWAHSTKENCDDARKTVKTTLFVC